MNGEAGRRFHPTPEAEAQCPKFWRNNLSTSSSLMGRPRCSFAEFGAAQHNNVNSVTFNEESVEEEKKKMVIAVRVFA